MTDPQLERLALLVTRANFELTAGLHKSTRRELAAWLIERGVTLAPTGEPPSAFPRCEVCGSSAWFCSVCLPQPPSRCCVACYRELREAARNLCEAAVEGREPGSVRWRRLIDALSLPCTHAAGSSEPNSPEAGQAARCPGYQAYCDHVSGPLAHCGRCGQPEAAHRKERAP